MIPVIGYAAKYSFTRLKPFRFERESAGLEQVKVAALFCGIWHTNIASLRHDTANA